MVSKYDYEVGIVVRKESILIKTCKECRLWEIIQPRPK